MKVLAFSGHPDEAQALLADLARYFQTADDLADFVGQLRIYQNRAKTGSVSLQFHFKDGKPLRTIIETSGYALDK